MVADQNRHQKNTSTPIQVSSANAAINSSCQQSLAESGVRMARSQRGLISKSAALLSLLAAAPVAMAETCISLQGSTTCPAFTSASISTDTTLVGLFSFLQYVSDTDSFDTQLASYVKTTYVQEKYENLLGCSNISLTNTAELYARYTTTVICNSIVQNSKSVCNVSDADAPPVCADACADFAESESYIIADSELCTDPSSDAATQIRADFTNCALPANSLSETCVEGYTNESDNCGYGNSTIGLCAYCGSGGENSTDTCCYNANAESVCANVVLPTITSSMIFTATSTSTSTASASATSSSGSSDKGLSGGAIAGIVIGSIVGLALLAGLLFLLIVCLRRRSGSQNGSIFNQPSPARKTENGMSYNPVMQKKPDGYEVLPGGRIARMSALEGNSGSPPRGELTAAAVGAAAGYGAGRRSARDNSSSDGYSATSEVRGGILRPPPMSVRRSGSLSSGSVLNDLNSPVSGSGNGLSSPNAVGSQQSEQLSAFKDYYSQEEIRPGDRVSTLWAYQPRAGDEFPLERGDMLKVIGIWDDGWATGVLLSERAEEWDERHNPQRDSGVSNGSNRDSSPAPINGEIKAFPLVCVCLPQYWRRTIEGDGSTETGSTGGRGGTMTS